MVAIFALFLVFDVPAWAAPLPGTATSKIAAEKSGVFHSNFGFTLDARGTNWGAEAPTTDTNGTQILYRKALPSKALVTVRTDESKATRSLEAYMKKWPLLYRRLGFEIQNDERELRNGEEVGKVELYSKADSRKTLQYVFFRRPVAVIISCSDVDSDYQMTTLECDRLARSFRWEGRSQNMR